MGGIVTLTTDFGLGEYVGAMKGAILAVDPDLTVVDLDHNVRPHDVRHGAYVLYSAVPFYPFAAHVGVVDPGVGTKRRGIVCVCEGALLVGPDNGLLIPAGRRLGLKEVREITNRKLGRAELSDTFHGRDLFAPVAAHLMTGTKVKDVGPVIRDFVDLDFGQPKKRTGGFEGVVITHDRFGNIVTNIARGLAEKAWSFGDWLHVTVGGYEMTVPFVRAYALVALGDFLATLSSSGFVEISKRETSAAGQLEATPGMPVAVVKPKS
ncbi:MAG TPA: SAM-dependent chlorinase/fluorinase [Thermoplasmata archaeon]|nr:SAM-dependent chlorinase/fluorinase [Thermoplasmata archaeon]